MKVVPRPGIEPGTQGFSVLIKRKNNYTLSYLIITTQ